MNLETFEDGILIETTEIEDFIIPPNFSNFITQILFSTSYLKLVAACQNQEAIRRLELLAVRLELKPEITRGDLEIFKIIWDTVINSTNIETLLKEDNDDFNNKAESNYIPFRFAEDFKLIILLNE